MDPRLLGLYESELAFLRDMGGEFAAEFPKIAGRLGVGSLEVADPYVERLMEGFAFLAARIQLKLESEFPTFTQSLLQMVYPHYLAPTPSMAVVQFQPEDSLRASPDGALLPRGAELRSVLGTEDQTNCQFLTAHDVQMLPIELAGADYIASSAAVAALDLPERPGVKAAIRLRLRTTGEMPIAKLALEKLPLFLAGPEGARMRLYEQLIANVAAIYVRPSTRPLPWQDELPSTAIRALGFTPEEALLPRVPQSFDGYRLLQEYYAMPARFLFVEIADLDRSVARCDARELEIVLLLTRSEPGLSGNFGPEQFALFCAPAINLFPMRGDRVNIAATQAEHHVVPDKTRPLDFEVFSVAAVEGYAADGTPPQAFLPFYAANDLSRNPENRAYYMLQRRPRRLSTRARARGPRSGYLGHEVFLSLVDANAAPYSQSLRQLGLDLLCTNRDLPLAMPTGVELGGRRRTDFTLAVSAPVAAIRCLVGPTRPRECRADGDYAWRFISHLALNYLSLVDSPGGRGAAALRELLGLYLPSQTAPEARQLEGLLSIATRQIVRRIPGAGPVAAGRGLQLTLTIDEAPFGGAGGILLAAVLDRFLAKYVSINAFTETVLRNPERGEIMHWPMRLGQRSVL
jgi:type VI secretion system protein ImpG